MAVPDKITPRFALILASVMDAATPRTLGSELNALIADLYALELRTLVCSSNASGLHTHSLQSMLEQHASGLHRGIRRLAMRVCSIGANALNTLSGLAQIQRLGGSDGPQSTDITRMSELLDGNQQLVEYLKEAHALFDLHGDLTSTRLAADLLEEAEQRSFQLLQILKQR